MGTMSLGLLVKLEDIVINDVDKTSNGTVTIVKIYLRRK